MMDLDSITSSIRTVDECRTNLSVTDGNIEANECEGLNLHRYKRIIESFSKKHQLGILKIIKENDGNIINENKSGIYINMNFLSESTIETIKKYINYVQDQEKLLTPIECQKQDFKNTFFIEKEHRDNMI